MSIKQSKIQPDNRYRDAKTAVSRSTQGRTFIASTHDQNFSVMSSLGNESVSPSRHARLGSLLFSDFVFCKRASHVKTNRENIMLSHTQAKVFLECYNNITPRPKEKTCCYIQSGCSTKQEHYEEVLRSGKRLNRRSIIL